MADVRLTALNPADSTTVPVACNAKGELLLEDPLLIEGPKGDKGDKGDTGDKGDPGQDGQDGRDGQDGAGADGNFNIACQFNQNVKTKAAFSNGYNDEIQMGYGTFTLIYPGNPRPVAQIYGTGRADFADDVTVGSRNQQWLIVESNGIAHLQATTRNADGELEPVGPTPTRNIQGELTMVEQQLQAVLEKLQMAPQSDWQVWDGSN